MSLSAVISVLKGTAMRQRPTLFAPHPLIKRSAQFRSEYLAYIALCVAVDRTLTPLEERAFLALSKLLELPEDSASKQLTHRASLTEDQISAGVSLLEAEKASWICLLDIMWLQSVNGEVAENDRLACQEFGVLLGVSVPVQQQLYSFLATVYLRNAVSATQMIGSISASKQLTALLQQAIDLIPSNAVNLPAADWRTAHKIYTTTSFRTESSGALVHFDMNPKGDMLLLTFEYRIVLISLETGKEFRNIKYCRDDDYSDFLKKENTYGIKTPLAATYFSIDGRWMITVTSESDKYKSIAVIFDLMDGNPETYIETFSNDTTISLTDIEKNTNIIFCHKGRVSVFDEDSRAEKVLVYPKYRTATHRVSNDAVVKSLVELIDKTPFADASAMMAADKHWLAIETNPKTIQIRSVSELRGAIISSDAIVGYGFTPDSRRLVVADRAGYITLWRSGDDIAS